MEKEKIIISFNDTTVSFTFDPFDTDIDMDELTSINYSNLYGEMVTVSTLMNKIGLLQADAEAHAKRNDLELAIYKSNLFEQFRKSLSRKEDYVRKEGSKIIEPGNTEIENAVYKDPGYQNRYKENITVHRNLKIIETLYWSIKSKDTKLSALMTGVTPVEFQGGILEGEVNKIYLKKHKSVLPSNELIKHK